MLKNMTPAEIKELYKATLPMENSLKKGCRIGIIEMAKIADDRIDGYFSAIDKEYSYFILRLVIRQF